MATRKKKVLPVLLKIGGTSGSGKSTIVHRLLETHKSVGLGKTKRGAIDDYHFPELNLVVLGKYDNQCGGCDGLQIEVILERLKRYADSGKSVLMEGLLIGGYGRLGATMDLYKKTHRVIHGFMDTPLDTCLNRVRKRRADRGDDRPFDETNTRIKWEGLRKRAQTMREEGHNVVQISHRKPVEHVLAIIAGEA